MPVHDPFTIWSSILPMSAPDDATPPATDGSARPWRVLMSADAVGGVWRYALDLATELRALGIETCLAVVGPPPTARQLMEARRACAEVEVLPCRLEWMAEPWADVDRSGQWLLQLAQSWAPDVVHLNGYAHAALPWDAPALVAAHSCVCSWWRAVHGVAAPPEWDGYRARVRRGLHEARLIVAPSAAMREAVEREYGPCGEIRVVPNARARGFSIGGDVAKEPFVFAAGRLWDSAKNVRALCAAAPSLAWPVYVAGDASLDATGVADLGGVQHLGVLSPEQVEGWMSRAGVYALPARYEPFGLSVLEAAAAGCALVLGDIDSLRENWTGAALFVAPDDPMALSGALERLIADGALRESLGRQARERSRQFSGACMAAGYAAAYTDMLAVAGESRVKPAMVRS
jgi:glycosyltransferase involved in cell wall biosynthesis